MRTPLFALASLCLVLPAACAHRGASPPHAAAERPPTLRLAAEAVAQAKAGPASQLGGPAMQTAEHELNKAERKARHGDVEGAETHAYDALRSAQAADATAGLALAQHEVKQKAELQQDPQPAAEKGAAALTEPFVATHGNDAETMALAARLRDHLPSMVAEPADRGGLCLTLAEGPAFRGNTAALLPAARQELGRLAQVLAEAHTARVQVLGRVPGTVSSAKASRLAEARTHAVVAYLLARGVAEHRVFAVVPKHDEPTSARRSVMEENVDESELHITVQTQPPLPARGQQSP